MRPRRLAASSGGAAGAVVLALLLAEPAAAGVAEAHVRLYAAAASSAQSQVVDRSLAEHEDEEALVWDPLEPVNRSVFAANETLDGWVLEPVAIGWDFVLPRPVQISINHFFENLVLPVRIANDVFQLNPIKALEDVGRLITNSSVGILGLFHPEEIRQRLSPATLNFCIRCFSECHSFGISTSKGNLIPGIFTIMRRGGRLRM